MFFGRDERVSDLSINSVVNEWLSSVKVRLPEAKSRLDAFAIAFEKESSSKPPQLQGGAAALTWVAMDTPLILYSLNMSGQAIVELSGVIEAFALRETAKHLGVPSRIFEHHSLPDLALVLSELGILDKDDIKFARKLTNLRNSLAHRNARKFSNVMLGGRKISFLDIESVMTRYDPVPTILRSIRILLKLFEADREIQKDRRKKEED